MQHSLPSFIQAISDIITQIIKSKFIVCTVSDISIVSLTSRHNPHTVAILLRRLVLRIKNEGHLCVVSTTSVLEDTNSHAKQMKYWAHPFRITASQVIVDRDQMRATAQKRVQVKRQSRHQGFSLAGTHFRNTTCVQHLSAYQLNWVMAQSDGTDCSFPDRGKRRNQNVIKSNCFSIGYGFFIGNSRDGATQVLSKKVCFVAKLRIGKRLIFRF